MAKRAERQGKTAKVTKAANEVVTELTPTHTHPLTAFDPRLPVPEETFTHSHPLIIGCTSFINCEPVLLITVLLISLPHHALVGPNS